MTITQSVAFWQRQVTQRLKAAGIEEPQRTSWDLLHLSTGLSKAHLMTTMDKVLNKQQLKRLQKVVQLRCSHMPFQYIMGSEAFWGMTLEVGKGVLIPRPETELLIEVVKKRFHSHTAEPSMVDLCTGSGNIALALAHEYPQAKIIAVDKSKRALNWAKRNQILLGKKNIRLILGDMISAIPKKQYGKIAVVTSNPPYVSTHQMSILQAEVRYEPKMALHGGQDGLREIRKVVDLSKQLLQPGGLCVCEIGIGQSQSVQALFSAHGFEHIQTLNDWQKIPRIVSALFKPQ